MDRAHLAELVASRLRDVNDFPKPRVVFKDFTPLLADPVALRAVVDDAAARYDGRVDLTQSEWIALLPARELVDEELLELDLLIGLRRGGGVADHRRGRRAPWVRRLRRGRRRALQLGDDPDQDDDHRHHGDDHELVRPCGRG